ncbi:hypothetical protein LX32DRAFT_235102 [Colletotrichum zoysiae]|uniref:Uncharacterized protein n=1 Tax=Colletotrichum zoysiae TaxID=1216348 RepID=A0AAD9H417_9PEZI|nr:hypothetical protein LX32DRAFT_235102 [Colletotrichum zoysiae]
MAASRAEFLWIIAEFLFSMDWRTVVNSVIVGLGVVWCIGCCWNRVERQTALLMGWVTDIGGRDGGFVRYVVNVDKQRQTLVDCVISNVFIMQKDGVELIRETNVVNRGGCMFAIDVAEVELECRTRETSEKHSRLTSKPEGSLCWP